MAILTVGTFNICAIPLLTPHPKNRLKAAADYLAKIDIVAVQELTLKRYFDVLEKKLPQHQAVAQLGYILVRGGLGVFSRTAILHSEFVPFKNQGPCWSEALFDRFLQKGFLIVETPDCHFVNTHLLSNYKVDPKNRQTQLAQIEQLLNHTFRAEYLTKPIIVAGDANASSDHQWYTYMREAGFQDCSKTKLATWFSDRNLHIGGQRDVNRQGQYDYIFARGCRDMMVTINHVARQFEEKQLLDNGLYSYLSDHLLLEASLEFRKRLQEIMVGIL